MCLEVSFPWKFGFPCIYGAKLEAVVQFKLFCLCRLYVLRPGRAELNNFVVWEGFLASFLARLLCKVPVEFVIHGWRQLLYTAVRAGKHCDVRPRP